MQQFSPWIAGFPGLIWSIDIPHSRLKVFNRWSIPGLDVPRLLKDARYRKKAVRREDHALLMEFWDMLTARRPAAVTFRLTNGNGTYILQGWPGENDTLYYGFLKEAFLPAAYAADGRPCPAASPPSSPTSGPSPHGANRAGWFRPSTTSSGKGKPVPASTSGCTAP